MNNIKLYTILFLFFSSNILSAQNIIGFQWQRYFGGSKTDLGKSIAKSNDGGFIIVGSTASTDGDIGIPGVRDSGAAWIIKFNTTGAIQWKKLFERVSPNKIIQTSDSNFVICGYDYSNFTNKLSLTKLNATGNLVWQRSFSDTDLVAGISITEAPDKNLIVTGYNNSNQRDLWIAKISQDANTIIWKAFFKGSRNEEPRDIKNTLDGGFIITGFSSSNDGDFTGIGTGDQTYNDIILIKLNSSGVTEWKRKYHLSSNDVGNSVIQTSDSGYIIAGYTASSSQSSFSRGNACILKTNSSGIMEWQKSIVNNGKDTCSNATSIIPNSNKNGYVLCGTALNQQFTNKAWLLSIDFAGNILWRKRYDTDSTSGLNGIILANDSTYISTGNVYRNTQFKYDLFLIKTGSYNTIKGSLFLDENANGSRDSNEPVFTNAFVNTVKNGEIYSSNSSSGSFYFETDTGTYISTVQLVNPYYTVILPTRNSTFTTYFNVDTFSFAVQPIADKEDLSLSLLPTLAARPGFNSTYVINYKNIGTTTITNGSVKLIKDSRTSFVSAFPATSSIIGDTLVWDYINLKPMDTTSIVISLKTAASPIANINDTLKLSAVILPVNNDLTPGNDTSILKQRIVASYDPNDKQENYAGAMPIQDVNNGSYINYFIRFQNTGNDTAFKVVLADTLDANLDWPSFQMIGSSHAYNLSIKDGNKLMWTFDNIKLVDSFHNELLSHGFIAFKIKPKNTLTTNSQIKNTAAIYFDYNLPVLTNTTVTTIVDNPVVTAVRNISRSKVNLILAPNPARNQAMVLISGELSGKFELTLSDNYGRVIFSKPFNKVANNNLSIPVDLQNLKSGVYYIRISQKQNSRTEKIVIQ